jgi:Short C-terminal domain
MATEAAYHTKTSVKAAPSVARLSRKRRIAIWSLIVLATIIALVGSLTLFAKRQMLDNTAWKNTSTQVIQNQKVQTALAAYMVNQLYDNVNVAQRLQQAFPPRLDRLAAPLASALRQPAQKSAEAIIARPRFQQAFVNLSVIAHQKLVNVLENKTGHGISTGNGVVTLDLHTFISELGTQLGLPASALAKIPADAGVITLMKSSQLSAAQQGVRLLKVLSTFVLIAVLALYALAIYLARGARRRTLRNVGWSFTFVGITVLLVRRALGNWAVDTLSSPSYKGTVHDVWLIGTAILGQIGTAALIYGLVTVLAASLAGPTRIGTKLRGWLAPTLNEQLGAVTAVVGGLYLLLVLWGPTYSLRTWWGILLFAALIATGLYALRKQTLVEFPHVDGEQEPVLAPATATAGGQTATDQIARLAGLHNAGAISDDEFNRAKQLALDANGHRQ